MIKDPALTKTLATVEGFTFTDEDSDKDSEEVAKAVVDELDNRDEDEYGRRNSHDAMIQRHENRRKKQILRRLSSDAAIAARRSRLKTERPRARAGASPPRAVRPAALADPASPGEAESGQIAAGVAPNSPRLKRLWQMAQLAKPGGRCARPDADTLTSEDLQLERQALLLSAADPCFRCGWLWALCSHAEGGATCGFGRWCRRWTIRHGHGKSLTLLTAPSDDTATKILLVDSYEFGPMPQNTLEFHAKLVRPGHHEQEAHERHEHWIFRAPSPQMARIWIDSLNAGKSPWCAEVDPTFAARRRRQEGAGAARGASVATAFLADPKTFESVFWPVCRGEAGRANVAELCAHIRSASTRLKFDTDAFPTLRALRAALFERANDAGAVSWDDLKGAVEATAGAAQGLLKESSLET
jgi:hypothetical protein